MACSVRGIERDDGFTIGRLYLPSALSLFFVTMFLGSTLGRFFVLG